MRKRVKKVVLTVVSLLFSGLVLEVGAAIVYWRVHGKPLSRGEVQERLFEATPGRIASDPRPAAELPGHVTNKILHPYLGYVFAPSAGNVNSYGFIGPEPLLVRSPDTVNVVIMGGSVALGFAAEGSQQLATTLRTIPRLHGKNVVITSLAVDGYKQPQQLLALTWFLSLGAQLDILVNLDGFNEVALPFAENLPAGVSVSFPRAWNLYVSKSFDPDTALQVGSIVRLRAERASLRRLFRHWPWRSSVFCLTLWDSLDRTKDAELKAEDMKLRGLLHGYSTDPAVLGPIPPGLDEEVVFQEAVRVWRDSSLQMATLCRANGIEYFHFLQPNQYVAGSKTLNEEEKRTAFVDRLPFREAVEKAYPRLREQGRELRRRGVAFFDLTPIYRAESGTVYIDACCHVNPRGNEIMAREIGKQIGGVLNAESGAARQR